MEKSQQNILDFVDKCTARWLFEKTGVELYGHALKKCPNELKPKFTEIRDQEKEHEEMLEEVIRKYGGDPHQITPSARITKIESEGIVNVVENENFDAVIDALLGAELIDAANWELLLLLADNIGDKDSRDKFEKALHEETEHLRYIRENVVKMTLVKTEKKVA